MTAAALKEKLEAERETLSRTAKSLFASIDRILKLLNQSEGDELKADR